MNWAAMFITKIRKRDGRIVDFDSSRIKDAVHRALIAVELGNGKRAESITEEVVRLLERKFEKRIPSVEDAQGLVVEVLKKKGYEKVAKEYQAYREKKDEIRRLREKLGIEEPKLTVNALEVLTKRYLLRDEEGRITETPAKMFMRVAKAIAKVDRKYGGNPKESEKTFYEMMAKAEFLPNSPTLFNAGTKLGQLSACFVLPVDDSLDSIFTAVKNMAFIEKSGGGVGFDFSKLRPKGDIVKSTKGVACFPSNIRINTNEGLLKVSNIMRKENVKILTHEGFQPIANKFDNGIQDVYEVVTSNGYSIRTTLTHKFLTIENDEFVLKPLSQLKERDYSILFVEEEKDERKPIPLISKRSRYKLTLDEELAYFIGLSFADANIVNDDRHHLINISLNINEEKIAEKIREILRKKLKYKIREYKREEYNKLEMRINSKDFVLLLKDNGLLKQNASFISVPQKIFRSPINVIASFVAGYLDGDGHFDGKRIMIKTSSKKMCESLAVLLTKLGTLSALTSYIGRRSRKLYYRIEIPTDTLKKRFYKRVRKYSIILKKKKLESYKNRMFSFPFNVIYKINNPHTRTKVSRHIIPYNSPVTHRRAVERLANEGKELDLSKEEIKYFKLLSKFYPVRIQSINFVGKERVFNIEVARAHKLIANGFYVSNSGPVSFMRVFDSATEVIKAGGKRRGAMMGVLRADHPDIVEFITSKQKPGVLSNFNVSVAVTDYFMKKVKEGGEYWLINPRNKGKVRKLKVKDVWSLMAKSAWKSGDPGVIFIDEINRYNPIPEVGMIEATNPCGEQPLLPYESCNLGSVNLSRMVEDGKVNWKKLGETVRNAVRFLDDVIDANRFPLREIGKMTGANRKIGLGVMGFADMLIKLRVSYDSEGALRLAEKTMRFVTEEARKKSVELGEERGSFPNFDKSIWKDKYHAMRNATVTTIAPTGSISIIAGCSSGIEPLFAISFMRKVLEGARLFEINPLFEMIAKARGFYSAGLLEEIARTGSVQGISGVPEDVKRVFVTALDIKPEWHVRMQAAFQKYTDNAVSKTVNLPHDATVENVEKVFWLAYRLKCKGITVYRYGSKPEQVLNIGEIKTEKKKFVAAESEYAGGCPTKTCPSPS